MFHHHCLVLLSLQFLLLHQAKTAEVEIDATAAVKYQSCCVADLRATIANFYNKMTALYGDPAFPPPQKLKIFLEVRVNDTGIGMSSSNGGTVLKIHWAGGEDYINTMVKSWLLSASFGPIAKFKNDFTDRWLRDCFISYAYIYLRDGSDSTDKKRPNTSDRNKDPRSVPAKECAYWMNYVVTKVDGKPDVGQKVFKMARDGNYTDLVWIDLTGKDVKQLWDEMK